MKERPILFSAEMVRALLAGRKTQTRRILKVQPPNSDYQLARCMDTTGDRSIIDKLHWIRTKNERVNEDVGQPYFSDYAKAGDRLWVKETFYYDICPWANGGSLVEKPKDFVEDAFYYRADGECCQQIPECQCASTGPTKWRPSIFMPRWASRLTLEIKTLRVERLQDISEADAIAEGIRAFPYVESCGTRQLYGVTENQPEHGSTAKIGYEILWESLNGAQSWKDNPWVWVIEFIWVNPSPSADKNLSALCASEAKK